MGYTTEFTGSVEVVPPLNSTEVAYLKKLAATRRMKRHRGPYFVDGSGFYGQDREYDVLEHNAPDPTQPGLWCQWEPADDGTSIAWNGGEKFYNSEEWMTYIIDHFLKPGALAATVGDEQFAEFTFNHTVNGAIEARGESDGDLWRLIVTDNEVSTVHAEIVWPEASE